MNNQQQKVPQYLKVDSNNLIVRYRQEVDNLLYSNMVMQQQMEQMEVTIKNLQAKLKEHGIDENNSNDTKQQDVKLPK